MNWEKVARGCRCRLRQYKIEPAGKKRLLSQLSRDLWWYHKGCRSVVLYEKMQKLCEKGVS